MVSLVEQEEALVSAIQSLIGSSKEDFTEDTIIGSDINQIRHLFYHLRAEDIPVYIGYQTDSYRGKVTEIVGSKVTLSVPDYEEGQLRRLRLKFEALNVLYQFEVGIHEVDGHEITIRMPATLQSAQRRRFKRMYTDDLFMRFNVLYRPIFGRRGVGQMVENRYSHIVTELKKDDPDLPLVNRIITKEINLISPDFEIKFYGTDYKKNLMEQLVSNEQKTLYLRDTTRPEAYYDRQTLLGLINYEKDFRRIVSEESMEEAIQYFENYRIDEVRRFILTYVCTPLMVFDKVVGHIYVYSTVWTKRMLGFDEAQAIEILAQLMNYAMSKTAIARTYYRHTMSKIINLSQGGLLFELNNRVLFDYLTSHDRLKVLIPIRHNMLQFLAEITRFYPTNNESINVALSFFHAEPDHERVLAQYIHERSMLTFR